MNKGTSSIHRSLGGSTQSLQHWHTLKIGQMFSRRCERGRAGLPVMSITMAGGLVERSSVDRRVESNLPPEGHLLVRAGDLAYNMMRMWQGVLGRGKFDCLVSPAYIVLQPSEQVDPQFAEYLFSSESAIAEFKRLSYGVVDDRLRLYYHDLDRIPFALPKQRLEQRRIAEILSTLDETIEQTESLIAKYEQIRVGLMHDLFTRGLTPDGQLRPTATQAPHLYKQSPLGWIPTDWETGRLADFIGPIQSGWSPNCLTRTAGPGEWGILKTTAIAWDGYRPSENKALPPSKPPSSIEVRAGDILITRKGPVDRVGVVAYVHETPRQLVFPDTVFRVRLLNSNSCLPPFLARALGSNAVQKFWWQRKVGLADAQVNLNHGILRNTQVPIPSLQEQEAILVRLLQPDESIERTRLLVAKLRAQKLGMMNDLLTGRVRVKAGEVDPA